MEEKAGRQAVPEVVGASINVQFSHFLNEQAKDQTAGGG
jgi:hypothetical protein